MSSGHEEEEKGIRQAQSTDPDCPISLGAVDQVTKAYRDALQLSVRQHTAFLREEGSIREAARQGEQAAAKQERASRNTEYLDLCRLESAHQARAYEEAREFYVRTRVQGILGPIFS